MDSKKNQNSCWHASSMAAILRRANEIKFICISSTATRIGGRSTENGVLEQLQQEMNTCSDKFIWHVTMRNGMQKHPRG